MRKSFLVVLFAAVIVGTNLLAADKPPDSFVQLMKSTGGALQKVGKDVDAKDYDALALGAASIQKNFGEVSKFLTEKKMTAALEFCKSAFKAASDLEAAAKAKNDTGIADARKALTGSCAGCHQAHREKQPDGTFLIK